MSSGDAIDAIERLTKETVRRLIRDVLLKEIAARAIASAPWLAWPVIHPVFLFILSRLAAKAFEELERAVTFVAIDFKAEHHRAAYMEAVAAIRAAQERQDHVKLDEAKEEFRRRLRDLVRLPR